MRFIVAAAIVLGSLSSAMAADMTGPELKALMQNGKTLSLGGGGSGYQGSLTINADGTASGSATTDKGKVIEIQGTWRVKGNKFCRSWKGLDGGKEVCETWRKNSDNNVTVLVNGKNIGVNSWQ
jgi:hypothetical protein